MSKIWESESELKDVDWCKNDCKCEKKVSVSADMHRQTILVVSMLQHWPRYLDPTRGRNWINWFSSTSYNAGSPRTSSRTGFYNVYIQSDERGNRNTLWGGGQGLCKLILNIRVNKYKILSIYNIHFVHTSHII